MTSWCKQLVIMGLLLLPTTAYAGWNDWDKKDKIFFGSYAALTAVDMLQSRSAMRDPCDCYIEANPIFGHSHVTDKEVIVAGAISMAAMYSLIEKDAPDWAKWTMIGMRTAVVVNNHSIGVRIDVRI